MRDGPGSEEIVPALQLGTVGDCDGEGIEAPLPLRLRRIEPKLQQRGQVRDAQDHGVERAGVLPVMIGIRDALRPQHAAVEVERALQVGDGELQMMDVSQLGTDGGGCHGMRTPMDPAP